MAIEGNNVITMHHQAEVNFDNFTEVKFRDVLLTGTGHRDTRLNRDSPGQTGTCGRSMYLWHPLTAAFCVQQQAYTLSLSLSECTTLP